MLHPYENQSKLLGCQGWVEISIITLVYSKRVSVHNNLLHSAVYVCRIQIIFCKFSLGSCMHNNAYFSSILCPYLDCTHVDFKKIRYGYEVKNRIQSVILFTQKRGDRDWFLKFANELNIKIDLVHKVYEWPSCLFVKMIPSWENHFGKRTAWSLIYFWNYDYFDI